MFQLILTTIIILIVLILISILILPFQIFLNISFEALKFNGEVKVRFMGLNIFSRSLTHDDEKDATERDGNKKSWRKNVPQILQSLEFFINALPYIKPILKTFIQFSNLKSSKQILKLDLKVLWTQNF